MLPGGERLVAGRGRWLGMQAREFGPLRGSTLKIDRDGSIRRGLCAHSFLITFSQVKKPASVIGPRVQNTPTSAMSQVGRGSMGTTCRGVVGRAGGVGRVGATGAAAAAAAASQRPGGGQACARQACGERAPLPAADTPGRSPQSGPWQRRWWGQSPQPPAAGWREQGRRPGGAVGCAAAAGGRRPGSAGAAQRPAGCSRAGTVFSRLAPASHIARRALTSSSWML